jgi:hypothetical protein
MAPSLPVEVNAKWLKDVDAFLRSVKQAIKDTGYPVSPGFFRVDLPNQSEQLLEELIHSLNIDKAVEEAMADLEKRQAKLKTDADEMAQQHGAWGSIPDYPATDWQHEVYEGNTRASYWEWVAVQKEINSSTGVTSP